MLNLGKHNVLGVLIDAVDYEESVEFIIRAAQEKRAATISALAVHGLMTGVLDQEHRFRLNAFDLLVPDGQPVRWALKALHGKSLPSRVYGPNLTLRVCERAEVLQLPVYFYGSNPKTLAALKFSVEKRFPKLLIAGMEPSKFRQLTPDEKTLLASRIRESGAALVFVGLGCPRQETFAYEIRSLVERPMLAVGAAFPFLAGILPQAPSWMQDSGLEWLFRLLAEPRRLWRRYVFLNPAYILLIALQALGLANFSTAGQPPARELLFG